MKKEFKISLEFQGIVLFDPIVLVNFLSQNNINNKNLLEVFMNEEKIGSDAISQGIIYPIYTIPELDYDIIVDTEKINHIPLEWKVFNLKKYGVRVESGILIFTDIFTIIDWDDSDFFLNYKDNYSMKSDTNDFFELANGNYLVDITGFREGTLDEKKGYQIILEKTQILPKIIQDENIDMVNYDLTTYSN